MLNYIIATYSANRLEYSLQMQLQILYSIIMQDKIEYLTQVTIVCPPVKPNCVEHPFYYQKEMWSNLFAKTKVKLVYLDYKGDNKCASYDQWIQGYLAFQNFDYFLFIEDDYCIHPSLANFDSILVNYYCEQGYMCTLASSLNSLKHHAAISNGMVDKKTMLALGPNVLEDFYKLASIYEAQYAFSIMFENKNIEISSMHTDFVAWFWSSVRNCLEIYSDNNISNLMFVPVQYLLQPHFVTSLVNFKSKTISGLGYRF